MRAIVFRREERERELDGRTIRSLKGAGIDEIGLVSGTGELARRLGEAHEPLFLIKAGAWLAADAILPTIPRSAGGRALIGLGTVRRHPVHGAAGDEAAAWSRVLGQCGGDFARRRRWACGFPDCKSLYLEPSAAHEAGLLLEQGIALPSAVFRLVRSPRCRVIHLPVLNVHFEAGLRVVQLVTTIQIGGAERVTLDLATELRGRGVAVCVAVFGQPTRLAFREPANFVDLSSVARGPESRADAVARLAHRFGADLVHAHLIRAGEAQAIRKRGIPLVMTIHNMPRSWPAGLGTAGNDVADLLLACSNEVAGAARTHLHGIPVRTVWNGIEAGRVAPSREREEEGRRLRKSFGIGDKDFVIVAVANPRRQKRLDRLPEIIANLQARFSKLQANRRVHLLLAGRTGRRQ